MGALSEEKGWGMKRKLSRRLAAILMASAVLGGVPSAAYAQVTGGQTAEPAACVPLVYGTFCP